MSRGPTRRACSLLDSGALTPEILQAADHEADLLAHPYIGVEHIQLARLRLAGSLNGRPGKAAIERGGATVSGGCSSL